MGRVLISSTKATTQPPAPTVAGPIVVTTPELTGGGSPRDPLGLAKNMMNPDRLVRPGFTALLGSPSGGAYLPLQLGPGFSINTVTNTLHFASLAGSSAIATQSAFQGDGSNAHPLDLKPGGVQLSKLSMIPPVTLLANPTPQVSSPAPVGLGDGLSFNLTDFTIEMNLGAGLKIVSGAVEADTDYLASSIQIHTSDTLIGSGSDSSPLGLAPGRITMNYLQSIGGYTLLGNPDPTQTTPKEISLGDGLSLNGGMLHIDRSAFTVQLSGYARLGHQHSALEITRDTLSPDRLPFIDLTKLAKNFGGKDIADGATIVWDAALKTWRPSKLNP